MLLLASTAPMIASAEATADPLADANARLFKPVPGKAVIYLMRDRGTVWKREVPVYLDGREVGSSVPQSYFRWEVEPGTHVLISETSPPAVLEVSTQPGGVYYVWQDLNPGFLRGPSELRQVDETTARATLYSAVMLQSQ
jgi:hypothetical protein